MAFVANAFALWQMRQSELESAARHLARLARGLAEQTSRELIDADSDLLRIIGAARLQPERLLDAQMRAQVMHRNVSSIQQAEALAFVDSGGTRYEYKRAADDPAPDFPPVAGVDGLVIRDGSDRELPGLFLQRTLAVGSAQAGVLLLRFSEGYLGGLFRAWRGATPAVVALASLQGRTLLGYPETGAERGKPLGPLLAARRSAPGAAGLVHYSDPVDGRSYLLASEPVPDFPLVIHAWIAERDVLAQWLRQAALLAGTTLALTLIALALARRHATELTRRAAALGRMQDLQSALAAGEAQIQRIVRTVPSAVFQARLTRKRTVALSFMSAQIETLWGLPPEAIVRHPRRALWKVPRAHRRQLLEELAEAVRNGGGWDVTVPIHAAPGMRWLRIHAAPGDPGESQPTVWDGIISDVSEQKLAERQVVLLNLDLERRVAERTQELAELNKELEAFSDSVSHDLRAPLRGIRGYAEIVRSGPPLPGEAAVLIERIAAQGAHMETLIEALLELSQLSRYELRRTAVDLSEIATATLQELAARDPSRSVAWHVQPDLSANADPRLMRVLFENLLGNAWKFTRERSDARIEVGGAAKRAGETVFFVRDNGAGFDPDYAERLFRPFQRLHPASRFEGTGIGLATVQRIIRRHGGRIWAESRPGEGAAFHFELPVQSLYTRAQ